MKAKVLKEFVAFDRHNKVGDIINIPDEKQIEKLNSVGLGVILEAVDEDDVKKAVGKGKGKVNATTLAEPETLPEE